MMAARCRAVKGNGRPCKAPPLRDEAYCFWHSPEHQEAAAEARRLGELRRRKEHAVRGAYELDGLDDIGQARRWVEIAAIDALALENSIARARTLATLALAALRLQEQTDLTERIGALEQALKVKHRY